MKINDIITSQRMYFDNGRTLDIKTRKNALIKLKKAIIKYDEEILEALHSDLNKAHMEGFMTEVSVVIDEINYTLKHIDKWAKPQKVKTPISNFPSKSVIYNEPYGIVLVLSPWNYPFQLCLAPTVGAIAAGNCVIIKPSKSSPSTANIIEKIINETFEQQFAYCIEQKSNISYDEILDKKYDYIMFTGSENVGKTIMESAAKHLTPVTLELGGKSPCIIDKTADIKLTAKRLAWGKYLNAGQTCVAPDFVLAHKDIKDNLIMELKSSIKELYGENPLNNNNLPKIISQKHFDRLLALIHNEEIVFGGNSNKETLKIEPTILNNITFDAPVMQEEIFGPIMPILEYEDLDTTIKILQNKPHPLALYLFTKDKNVEKKVISSLIYGGGCVNDVVVHLANHNLPFGGVGSSGMGSYHGKKSFETFTHKKSVLKKALWLDVKLRYAPYTDKKFKTIRKLFK